MNRSNLHVALDSQVGQLVRQLTFLMKLAALTQKVTTTGTIFQVLILVGSNPK